ncbi:MAG: endonuclease/exonuclease/phosphatase family protein [Roseibacillus sp.]
MRSLSVLTWNILRENTGLLTNHWTKRSAAFHELLHSTNFDLICLQEVLPNQLLFFQELFPHHQSYGVGREDGQSKGEHCVLFFRKERFQLLGKNTFWISPTPEVPSKGWGEAFPRICSSVQLQDHDTSTLFDVHNLHLQLHPYAQIKAADLLAKTFQTITHPQIVTGDFNCPAHWPAIQRLQDIGLRPTHTDKEATFHFRGLPLRTLDHILISNHWSAEQTKVHNEKGQTDYPSDHFGLSAKLSLSDKDFPL